MPSSSATSREEKSRTSLKISAARCRGGRTCKAARNDSETFSEVAVACLRIDSRLIYQPFIGVWFQPCDIRGGYRYGCTRIGCLSKLGRQELPAPALVQGVQAGIGSDLVKPCPERRPSLIALEALPGAQIGLLYHILGFMQGTEQSITMGLQFPPVWLGEFAEMIGVTGPGGSKMLKFCGRLRERGPWGADRSFAFDILSFHTRAPLV